MAFRCRAISRPAVVNLVKFTIAKPSSRPIFSFQSACSSSSPLFSRSMPQMGALMSLLPLHTAISSARLTSCLGADTTGCRSLSQELGLCVPR